VAFLETITHLRPRLHRYCARMTGSIVDGEDVVQDALFRAYRKLNRRTRRREAYPQSTAARNTGTTQLEKGAAIEMKLMTFGLAVLLTGFGSGAIRGEHQYPPIDQYLMSRDAEIVLARTAAPAHISGRATIKVLTKSGYEVAHEGDNGVVCLVMRGFTAPTYTLVQFRDIVYDPTIHAPICFTPPAARSAMPYYELRTKLAIAGMIPDQIARALETAYIKGQLPKRDTVTFAYMWSAHQHLGPGIGARHPHVNGIRSVLRERDGRRQRLRIAASAGQRRCRHTVYGRGHSRRR
jgi:hypothetical protein